MLVRILVATVMLGAGMASQAAATGSAVSRFTQYPAFGDRVPKARSGPVEAIVDKGLMLELIVRCGGNSAVLTYSKTERLFCTPSHTCGRNLDAAIHSTCK